MLGKNTRSKKMRITGEARKAIFKKNPHRDCTKYVKPKLKRDEMSMYEGKRVEFSGEVRVLYNEQTPDKPVMAADVNMKGVYVDHLWFHLHRKDIAKAKLGVKDARWYFTGVVFRYASERQTKWGVKDVRLVTEWRRQK